MGIGFIQDFIDILRGKQKSKKRKIDWSCESKYVENIKSGFYNTFGRELDLDNLETFSEKMQYLRIYDNSPLKTELADKYLVRNWIKEQIGEEYLIPLLGVYDSFDEIDFDSLPNSFVIQCNHGCGYNIIVRDKTKFDKTEAKAKINQWLNENFAYLYGEWHYKDIKRKIIISEYLEQLEGDISDYKYFCFNGKPAYILLCTDRKSGVLKNSFFDLDWNNCKFNYTGELFLNNIDRPQNLELMNQLAEKLAKGFKHVRVDFYNINGKIYFGEMTFTAYGGYYHFSPEEWDKKFGDLLTLDNMENQNG